ncbi:hypothetical protein CAOG_005547 [Capsaspora owczarzaki ATCC 30864]|uniref:Uncharacterized protein n=1 Tax=Capsaspora owczarzaki (strain ATCC 30864) TaxID=595528 RepID=A0A0D2VUK1_CAPO3|nr:hypothetical protein CAOG_005547 [Capsaspora owczarzaki ATCC 30864]
MSTTAKRRELNLRFQRAVSQLFASDQDLSCVCEEYLRNAKELWPPVHVLDGDSDADQDDDVDDHDNEVDVQESGRSR